MYRKKLRFTSTAFIRSTMYEINWDARLIGIRGARGVGKTTLLLQHIKRNFQQDERTLYVSLDNIYFSDNRLYDFADRFVKRGGTRLYLDEVHKYPHWSQELKNIYDDMPELQIIFTGSSLLEILNSRADLSRRAIVYEMQGLSFREYLNYNLRTSLPVLSLSDLLERHTQTAEELTASLKVLEHFPRYLRHGYYPYYNELPDLYPQRVEEVVNMTLEVELPQLRGVDISYLPKIKQLLLIISESAPFIPNISKLSERIGITKNALLTYLSVLAESKLTYNLLKSAFGISRLQKPDKIYLENTNLMYVLSPSEANIGNIRETFFANQLKKSHQVTMSEASDFLVDGIYTFEIGGKRKGYSQIEGIPNGFIVADDIEIGFGNKIPLWMMGFLY